MIILEQKTGSTELSSIDQEKIQQILESGQVIVYPTDTLYGLGVDACSQQAVAELYRLKMRENAPVSVLLESVNQLFELADDLEDNARSLIQEFLPGAMTVICKSHYPFAPQLVSKNGTIGFRVPGDSLSRQLPRLLGRPITTTSVNPAGAPPASALSEVRTYFENQVSLMLDSGPLDVSRGSTVMDLTATPFKILREGEISRLVLQEFLN